VHASVSHYTLEVMANSPARGVVDVGSVIADTYTIEALLGRGGMGSVFRASHKRLAGKHVAIKILHTEIEDADVVARFKREAEIAARLNHPNIVGVIDYNIAPDGMPYLVLDYLEGETLAQRIALGPMTLDQVVSILRQVGSALAAAHRAGIVHRDLKPQNIFLVPTVVDGREVEIAKVLDFGISKIRGSQTVKTQDSTLLGTPQYMAPEQATGQHANIDERTDLFALGAIVYEMLTGQPAFSGASIPEVVFKVVYEQPAPLASLAPATPPEIVAAVNRAMAKPIDDRFPTVASFVESITGQPLTVSRAQLTTAAASVDSPSAARRVATQEAFAQTMGSGDFGGSPVNPLLATMAPATASSAPPQVAPAAPTIDLHTGPRAVAAQRHRRSTGMIAAIALTGAAVAAGAVYFVMRRPESPGASHVATSEPPTTPSKPSDAKAADARAADAKAAEARAADARAADAKAADAKAADARAADAKLPPHVTGTGVPKRVAALPPPPPAPPRVPDEPGDDDARDKLKQASAALERSDYDAAERLATAVINSPGAPKQHAMARLIHGTVQCVARNDQEAAQIDLRRLENFRALRGKLLSVCRSHGIMSQ